MKEGGDGRKEGRQDPTRAAEQKDEENMGQGPAERTAESVLSDQNQRKAPKGTGVAREGRSCFSTLSERKQPKV